MSASERILLEPAAPAPRGIGKGRGMAELLTTGAMLTCSFGSAPMAFTATPMPGKPVVMGSLSTATIQEIVPMANIPSFGMCRSLQNPQVLAATTAAQGTLTPQPCVPATTVPWAPPSPIHSYNGTPLATVSSKCACTWTGQISVSQPGQMLVKEQ